MPSASDIRADLRDYLDDPVAGTHVQGNMWSDTELNAALTAAQWSVYAYLVQKKQSYLLQKMVKSSTGTSNASLPGDYAFAIAGEVEPSGASDYRPARLYIGWTNRDYLYASNHFMTAVAGSTVEWWRNGVTAGVDGRLWYYKKPTNFDTATSHTDFDSRVYDPIVYLAAVVLQNKDDGTAKRALFRFKRAVDTLVKESPKHYPALNGNARA